MGGFSEGFWFSFLLREASGPWSVVVRRSHGNSGGEGYVGLTRLDAVLGD